MTNTALPRIGFVGLGKMGTPMARRLKEAGFEVTAYVRNEAGRMKAKALGIPSVDSLAEIGMRSDAVITAILDDKALLDIISGSGGLASHMKKGSTLIETSTVSPPVSAQVAELLANGEITYLRSPVSGSTVTAEAGALTVLVSGPKTGYEAALPIYAAFSKKQYHLGEAEQARYLKLTLNAMVGAMSALVGEALTLARAGGVEMADALEVINNSAVASPLIGYKTKMMTTGDYTPAFEVTGMMKDFDLALGVGRSEHLPMPIIAQVRQQYEAAYAAGAKDLDFFVLVREAARIAGIK
jgi:3-hydroxyisobutyrate dehydrogenase-like beta-hydroxyacid dehydrogenase